MLGWDLLVLRGACEVPNDVVARWRASINGIDWLEALVKSGRASDLGGNGYPCKYSAKASTILPILAQGSPDDASPLLLGDNYVIPAGWKENICWNATALSACESEDELIIEAWDLS